MKKTFTVFALIFILAIAFFSQPITPGMAESLSAQRHCPKHNKHCQSTFTLTPTPTKTITPSPTRIATQTGWFDHRYPQVDTSLYADDSILSPVLLMIPQGSEILFISYIPGDILVHVVAVTGWNGQTAVVTRGWIRLDTLGKSRPGSPTPTFVPRCYDC